MAEIAYRTTTRLRRNDRVGKRRRDVEIVDENIKGCVRTRYSEMI